MRLLPLLALLPGLAFAQGLTTQAPGQGGRPLLNLPLATPGCYASGSGLTVARNSVATYDATGNGDLVTCAANQARVGVDGLVVEGQTTNLVAQSNTMSVSTGPQAPWQLDGASVATEASASVGGTWAKVTGATHSKSIYVASTTVPSNTQFVGSIWGRMESGTGAMSMFVRCGGAPSSCACVRHDGGACTASIGTSYVNDCDVKVLNLGTAPVRMSAIVTCPGAITSLPSFAFQPGEYGVSGGTVWFSGAMLEAGVTEPSSHVPTVLVPVTRYVDQVSAPVRGVASKWCVALTAKAGPGRAWPNAQSLWTLGDNYNDANTASSWGNSSLYIVDKDDGVLDLGDYTDPTGATRIVTCNKSGALSLYVNGVLTDTTATGAGTGVLAVPATTLRLGAQVNGGTPFGGAIKGVKVCSGTWKDCK